MNQMSSQASVLTGQALGGLLYVSWGVTGLLLFDALSFAYGGLATWFIPRDVRPLRDRLSVGQALRRYALDTQEGLSYVWRSRGMSAILATFAAVNFLFMPVFVLLPFYVRDVLGGGTEWYGLLLAGAGAGALVGSAAAGVLGSRVRARGRLVRLLVAGVAGGVLLLAAARDPWLAWISLATIGASASIINVTLITSFQSAVPVEVRGRVMAVVIAISTAAVPLGMGLGGALGEWWPNSLPGVFAGCGAAIGLLILAGGRRSGFGAWLDADEHRES
jgi:predicted MFS family arabinose efflux permease